MKKRTRNIMIVTGVLLVAGNIAAAGAGREAEEADKPVAAVESVQAAPVAKEAPKKSDGDHLKVTVAKYGQIENGMTFRQVADIIGRTGTRLSEAGEKGTEAYAEVWSFEGLGKTGANAVITFQGGKVIAKAQYGLE